MTTTPLSTESHERLLVIVTMSQCPACKLVRSEVDKITKVTDTQKIGFVHITDDATNIVNKTKEAHPALIGVCQSIPSIFSIINITDESFQYVKSTLKPTEMNAGEIFLWWSSLTSDMHDKTATCSIELKEEETNPLLELMKSMPVQQPGQRVSKDITNGQCLDFLLNVLKQHLTT